MNVETPIEIGQLKQQLLATNPLGRTVKHKTVAMLLGLGYEIMRNPFYLAPYNSFIFGTEYLYFFHFTKMQKLFYPEQTTLLDLFRYIEWDEDKILTTIRSELGWQKDANSPSTWRFDCYLSFLKNHLLMKSIGITEKHDCLSAMVREGMITREQAMDRLEIENVIPPKAIPEALEQMGLDDAERARFLHRVGELDALNLSGGKVS